MTRDAGDDGGAAPPLRLRRLARAEDARWPPSGCWRTPASSRTRTWTRPLLREFVSGHRRPRRTGCSAPRKSCWTCRAGTTARRPRASARGPGRGGAAATLRPLWRRWRARASASTLRCEPRARLPHQRRSEDDVYQIVFNLAENAVKYNVAGGSVDVSRARGGAGSDAAGRGGHGHRHTAGGPARTSSRASTAWTRPARARGAAAAWASR